MNRHAHITGLILAGGSGRRLGGLQKAGLTFKGRRFIDRLVDQFNRTFGQTLIVTGDPQALGRVEAEVVRDIVPGIGVAMGLLTGLSHAAHDWSFITACDTPLLADGLIDRVTAAIDAEAGVVLCQTPDGLQPLLAAYHRRCAPILEELIGQGRRSIRPLFDRVEVRKLSVEETAQADPTGRSFININTPEDLATLKRLEADAAG